MNNTALLTHKRVTILTIITLSILAFAGISTEFVSNAQKRIDKTPDIVLANTITGKVFQDYNENGTYDTASGLNSIDVGVAGVTVTIYDSAGVAQGSAISDASGNYSVTATGTGPYRVEFTTLPAAYTPSARSRDSLLGGTATNAGSTTQFVNAGSTANVNLAVVRYEDYCQNNPTLVVPRFAQGAQDGAYANNPSLYDFPYNSGTTYTDPTSANYDSPLTHSLTTKVSALGTTYSVAYNRLTNRIYAAAYFKRHSGFGPGADGTINTADDPSAIYVVNPATSAVATVFSVPNVTLNSHQTNDYATDNADIGWDAVGKTSIGGMAIADDSSRLFVMNLEDRKLYALDPSTGANLGSSVALSTLTFSTPAGSRTTCRTADKRPFAVKYYRGSVYVGAVCSAESTGSALDLYAFIFQVNPTTLAVTATPTFSTQLNYSRGSADPGASAAWQPWVTTVNTTFAYPEPMLAGIEFENGNLILGLRDRAGDQALDAGPDAKRTAGDTLRACGSFGAWTLESNGRCGGTGSAAQNTGQGPGNGEFYYQDDFCLTPNGANYHDEVSWGSLLYVPGRQNVLSTLLDPISRTIDSSATFDGGIRFFNNSTGGTDRAYRVYNGLGGVGQPDFGKANGLGALTAMCSAAPIEIGNRIWSDTNNNGVQDPGELGIGGVTVHLYQGSTLVGTAVTDANGEYYFVYSAVADPNTTDSIGQINGGILYNTAYQIRLDRVADYTAGGALSGFSLTQSFKTSQAGNKTASDSNAVYVTDPSGSPAGTFPAMSLTTGGPGANDHTYDAGFNLAPSAADVSVDGRLTTADGRGIRNVNIDLIEQDGTTRHVLSGPFGYYRFDGVAAGQTVIVTLAAKRFTFNPPTRLVTLSDNLSGLDWVSNE